MRWEYLIGGQPMLEIAHAEAAAKSGDVVLTGTKVHLLFHISSLTLARSICREDVGAGVRALQRYPLRILIYQ
jgi:hypothetical protein